MNAVWTEFNDIFLAAFEIMKIIMKNVQDFFFFGDSDDIEINEV